MTLLICNLIERFYSAESLAPDLLLLLHCSLQSPHRYLEFLHLLFLNLLVLLLLFPPPSSLHLLLLLLFLFFFLVKCAC